MRRHHHPDPLLLPVVLQAFDALQTLLQRRMIHLSRRLVRRVYRVRITQSCRPRPLLKNQPSRKKPRGENPARQPYLIDVGSPHDLTPEEKVLASRLLQVHDDFLLGGLKVRLVRIEDDGLVLVVLAHHLEGDARDGWLEVGLFGVYHYPNV